MPNWCSNALSITGSDSEMVHIKPLFNGEFVNRTDEITSKLRQILLAGIGGVLIPSEDIDPDVYDDAVKLNGELATDRRGNDERSKAYSEFLSVLVSDSISPSNYDELDALYKRTGLHNLWWGNISKDKRRKIRSTWKRVSFDFSNHFRYDISKWWMSVSLFNNTSKEDVLDMRVLKPIPARIMVNGFNGHVLNCASEHDWYVNHLGTKWPVFDVDITNGNYVFSTAWSPVTPIRGLLYSFVANAMGTDVDELGMCCDLYFYEAGCAFQGINDETFEYSCSYDETGEYEDNMLEEIANAFDM